MKRCLLIFSLLLLSLTLQAQGEWRSRSAFRFGVEWGYSGTFYMYYHNNYIEATDGYRVDDEGNSTSLKANAYATVMLGADISRHGNLAAYFGYSGVCRNERLFTLALRGSWFWNGVDNNGWFSFIEGGGGINEYFTSKIGWHTRIGGGYRVSLSRVGNMDFNLSYRTCLSHPSIWDDWEGKYVEKRYVRRNNALYHSLCLGIAISF